MNKNSKFQKGSGVFNCDICGKATRETGKGEANFRLCAGCIEVSQVENGHSDADHDGEVWDCEECATWLSPQGKEHLDIYRKAQGGETAETAEAVEIEVKGTHQLTSDIGSPDAGILAKAGSMVRFLSEDENGCLVETIDGKHSFYVDADEIFEL